MSIIPLFPSLLYYCNIPVPQKLSKYSLEISKKEGVGRSNRGGWHSSDKLHEDKSFQKEYLIYFAQSIANNLDIPPFFFTSCWINVNKKGDYNVSHDHPNNDYSLVWYIKTPEKCGRIGFENPNGFAQGAFINTIPESMNDKYYLYPTYYLNAAEGNCYLFPAHLRHFVEQNESDHARISLSANLVFTPHDSS